jgi:hypothetical protein
MLARSEARRAASAQGARAPARGAAKAPAKRTDAIDDILRKFK